jgi:hypothetical protein
VADYIRKNRVLDEHCTAAHRDPAEITRSVQLTADLDHPATTRAYIAELVEAGARHIILSLPNTRTTGVIEQIVDQIIQPVKV